MITVLKGSPQYAISNDGLMTINTTWMVIPDNDSNGMSAVDWLAFQNEVEAWAGKPGDNYKMPKIKEGTREAFEFTSVDTFLVDTVEWICVDGRTHYEVTYSNVQNVSVMKRRGNVSVEVDNANERTKTIVYTITVGDSSPTAIDACLVESGTVVDWAGDEYLVEQSSYNSESDRRYEIVITAKEMSAMMVGLPTESVDGYGQRNVTAIWRFSKAYYDTWEQPAEGSDASAYIGGKDGYLISVISAEPQGVLGYRVTINAVHVSKKHLNTSIRRSRRDGTEYTINYQADNETASEMFSAIGVPASEYGANADAEISEVTIDEASRGNFNVALRAKVGGVTDKTAGNATVSVSGSSSQFVMQPQYCGWGIMVNGGGYYRINFPPTTTFTYETNPKAQYDMLVSSGAKLAFSRDEYLTAIKNLGAIGFDRVYRVYDKNGKDITNNAHERAALEILDEVSKVVMLGFVYAQPTMTESVNGDVTTFRNIYFEPWEAKRDAPVMIEKAHLTNYPKVNGRDKTFAQANIGREVPMMEFSVTHTYKGNTASILRKNWNTYFRDAVSYIKNTRFTSYKCIGINTNESTDDSGVVWTAVSVTVHALRYGYWNPNYGESDAYYVEHK